MSAIRSEPTVGVETQVEINAPEPISSYKERASSFVFFLIVGVGGLGGFYAFATMIRDPDARFVASSVMGIIVWLSFLALGADVFRTVTQNRTGKLTPKPFGSWAPMRVRFLVWEFVLFGGSAVGFAYLAAFYILAPEAATADPMVRQFVVPLLAATAAVLWIFTGALAWRVFPHDFPGEGLGQQGRKVPEPGP